MSAAGQGKKSWILKIVALAIVALIVIISIYCLFAWISYSRWHAQKNPTINASDVISPMIGGGSLVGDYDVDMKQANVDFSDGLSLEEGSRIKESFTKLRIINIHKGDQQTHYILWAYRRNRISDPINILIEVHQRRKVSTDKNKYLMFSEVLRPIKVIDEADVAKLLAGNIDSYLQAPSDFPRECVLLAYDDSFGPSYGIGYKTSEACNDKVTRASIVGRMNASGEALCTQLLIRIDGRSEPVFRKPQDMNCFHEHKLASYTWTYDKQAHQ